MSPLSRLAVPSVYGLIFFLGYPTQWLLMRLDPGPLTKNELIATNVTLMLIWITYTKSVFVDPGRIPKDWAEEELANGKGIGSEKDDAVAKSRKWCRKCDAAKPPRAHHCKECKRCIPKMDHHCPWTSNCVSHTTFPHFVRFLLYATLGLSLHESFLISRFLQIWHTRDLPSYLGPSLLQLAHLFATLAVNTLTLFVLAVLLIRNIWCLAVNTTTIEGWEIDRHATLVRRARHFGGYLSTPDGARLRIKHQEFPYDIGILSNISQGMGTRNPLAWFWPFSSTPPISTGLVFETNGFNDKGESWPPPDPDRLYRRRVQEEGTAFTFRDKGLGSEERIHAFRARQEEDAVRRRRPFVERLEALRDADPNTSGLENEYDYAGVNESDDAEEETDRPGQHTAGKQTGPGEGEESWRNSEGERLEDFGVDEHVEFYDDPDDDVPLSVLIARRQQYNVQI